MPETLSELFRPWGNVRHDLASASRRAGIEPVTLNDLRRTCATWLREGGIEPHLIAAVLGHADSRMVERVYRLIPLDVLGASLKARLGDGCNSIVAEQIRRAVRTRLESEAKPAQVSSEGRGG